MQQQGVVFAADVRRLDVSKAVVIQNNGECGVFEKSPDKDRERRLVCDDMAWRNNRQQLRDLGVGDAWLMLMRLRQMMWKEHRCFLPHEMWSRVLFFLLGMDIMRTSGRDGVVIICNITGKAHDKALRDLSDKDRRDPHNQRLFDQRFGVVPVDDSSRPVRGPQ